LQHFDAVRDSADNEAETFHCTSWFAGQANHECFFHDDRQVPRKNRIFVIFIDSIRITSPKPGNSRTAISRTASGRHIAEGNSGTASGEDKRTFGDLLAKGALDVAFFVRHQSLRHHSPAVNFGCLLKRRPAKVVIKPPRRPIGDGDDSNLICMCCIELLNR
jgi:hypothetical protein